MAGLLRPDEPFVAVHPTVARSLGLPAASVLGHIAYIESSEGAYLTSAQIADAVGISRSTVLRATKVLRNQGIIEAHRATPWDATLVYRVCWQHPVITGQTESAIGGLSTVPPVSPRESTPGTHLLSELEQLQELPAAVASEPEEAPVTPVPASYQEPLIPSVAVEKREVGPPKTAQTLVARWCDGYRSRNGHDAPGPLVKRVAGQMRNLAKACGDNHGDWVAAYSAAYACGTEGRWDPVGFMSRRVRPARITNAFVAPELGGPGAVAVTAMAGLLSGSTAPELSR